MDVLEKALLVDELKQLIDGLDNDKQSLFEIAKAKQRIKDICASCDDPMFQDQLGTFKSVIQQHGFPIEELTRYGYSTTYCGTFNFSSRLEEVLFAAPKMGWAALRQANHWQIWVVRPLLSFLRSPWLNSTEEALQWIQKNAQQYVKTDSELQSLIPVLESPQASNQATHKDTLSAMRQQHANFEAELEAIIQEKLQTAPAVAPQSAKPSVRPKVSFQQNQRPSANLSNKAKPISLSEFNLDGLQCRLERVSPKLFPSLYRVELENPTDQNVKVEWLYLKAENDEQPVWETAQIFVAEQLYVQGQFSHYVALIGTHSIEFATNILQTYTDQRHTRTNSIHQTSWNTFKQHYAQHESLFNECIMNAELVWQRDENAYPYIPASFINIQKFIPFNEVAANFLTPILLLKERQKIRVIHGAERIKLSPDDQAYPYLLLDRADGYTWQLIRHVISHLPQPISVQSLFHALENADMSTS